MIRALLLSSLFPSAEEPARGIPNLRRFQALSKYCEARVLVPMSWWGRRGRSLVGNPVKCGWYEGLHVSSMQYWSIPRLLPLHAAGMRRSLLPSLAALRQEFAFDVILASWAYPDAVAAADVGTTLKCPVVAMVMGSDINALPKHPAIGPQIRRGLRQCQGIIAVSQALGQRVIDLGVSENKVHVQRNGVDGTVFCLRSAIECRHSLGLPVSGKIVSYVGNLRPEKGLDVLIPAFERVLARHAEGLFLVIVGEGPLLSSLRKSVRERGIEDSVRFIGATRPEEVPFWIAASDLLCLPSFREGCPNVVLEALACGRPVVASNVGGVSEILRGDRGRLVPAGNVQALAQAIQEVLGRRWEADGLRESVGQLSWDAGGQFVHSVLERAVQKHQTTASRIEPVLARETAGWH